MGYASRNLASLQTVRERPHMSSSRAVMRTAANTTIPAINVTAGGSAHTKGSWATLVASTGLETTDFLVTVSATAASGSGRMGLMDIAFGPSGSPVMIVENVTVGSYFVSGQANEMHRFYRHIPAGSEIIARVQSQTASTVYATSIELNGNTSGVGEKTYTNVTTLGANTAASVGTALATPAGNNTEGAWTTILDPIVTPIHAVTIGIAPLPSASWQSTSAFIDLGVGAGGSETVIVPDVYVVTQNNEVLASVAPAEYHLRGCPRIPAGVRLAARFQTANVSQGMSVVVYGHN